MGTLGEAQDQEQVAEAVSSSTCVKKDSNFQAITFALIGLLAAVILASYIFSTHVHKNDFYRVGTLTQVSFRILDSVSDVFFALEITYCSNWRDSELMTIFVISVSCIA